VNHYTNIYKNISTFLLYAIVDTIPVQIVQEVLR
jgi:hypothetical protein